MPSSGNNNSITGKGVDTIAPTTTSNLSGTKGNNDWFVSNAVISIVATDSGSGVKEIRFTLDNNAEQVVTGAAADLTISGDGPHTLAYRAIDNAGNEAGNSVAFKIDSSAPSITGSALTSPNANGWYNGNVTVHFSATDALSGIASLTPDTVISAEGAGQAVTGVALDMAGNQSVYNVTGINVDKASPAITIAGVTDGATYNLGLVPTASFTAVDGISGVATSSGTLTGGDAQGLGLFTYTVTSVDKAGNLAITSVSYTVNATPSGTVTLIGILPLDSQSAANLSSTLATAKEFYANGNSIAGDEKMGAFINQVSAPGQNLPSDIVAMLINAANYIIAHN